MDTPLLLIIFNRPHETRVVLDEIRKIKPSRIFIAADGPRDLKSEEKELCKATREIVMHIDWPCEINTLFQEKNLGCKQGPITAINWFFEHVDEGIILEDDCIPDPTFFTFCTELLAHYRSDKRIMHISGNNFQEGIPRGDKVSSYYFSKYTHSWGWATWKRAWKLFLPAIDNFEEYDKNNEIQKLNLSPTARRFWIKNFRHTLKGNDSWDSLWMFTVWYNEGLAVLPQKNLVSNIGFNENATHTKTQNSSTSIKTFSIDNVNIPKEIIQDKIADEFTFKKIYSTPLLKRILLKIRHIITE